ncbi:Protein CBG17054 [Caenorhabditis briggsae]|uniref:Protein CBG17054 n=1 Tax=Caenorhabditis briggsae TaxID=6238 RepID=A8XQC3_CAEBR|nr:Protein CBG17054 [Caenorhabditis briggsae]CAP34841.2 Protein CBG17054 [Caenorhabditis briggsae]
MSLSKEAITLANLHAQGPTLRSIIWYPISCELIGALIYMLSQIKCPRITPDCFEEAEQLIRKYCSDAHWEFVWSSIKEQNIKKQYWIEYTGLYSKRNRY